MSIKEEIKVKKKRCCDICDRVICDNVNTERVNYQQFIFRHRYQEGCGTRIGILNTDICADCQERIADKIINGELKRHLYK